MPLDLAGKIGIGVGIGAIVLGHQLLRELNPLGGDWWIRDGTIDGHQLTNPEAARIRMEVRSDDRVVIESLWTCGVQKDQYAYGSVYKRGGRYFIREEYSNHEPTGQDLGELRLQRDGTVRYEIPYCPEGKLVVIFKREENLHSIFDAVGWQR